MNGTQADALQKMLSASDVEIVDGIFLQIQKPRPRPKFYDDESYRRFIARLSDLHSTHYKENSVSALLESAMKRDLLRLAVKPQPPIFDLGCGQGSGFDLIGGADKIVGVDSSRLLLKEAKQRYPSATLICAELHDLPLKDRSVITMFAIASLEHVFDLELSLAELSRCLHPDGFFYVLVPTEGGVAVELARSVTSRRNARLIGITPRESARAQRKDHCNTVFAIENALRKFFRIEATAAWPFRVGGSMINLAKSYRLRSL